MLAQGRPRGLKNVLLAEAHRLPFGKGSFDFSMSNHVLHLLDNWTGALQEMCRVSRDSFVSVVDRPGAIPDLDHEYYDAVTASGIDTSRPGLPERELATRVPPDETIPLGRFHDTASAESWVKLLGLKSSTSQWVVPSDVHEQIMRELERNHRDETVRWWVDIELVRWNAGRLSAALERW
jgi:SAM-dependent methyltransferase